MRLFLSVLAAVLFMSAGASALTLEEAVNLAIKNNDSIQQQRQVLEAQKSVKKSARAAFLPTAGVGYGYSETATYDSTKTSTTPNPITGVPPSYSGGSKESSFAINLGYNLFNGLADWNRYKTASTQVDMQQYQYEGNKQDIILTTKSSYISYLNARSQLNVAKETLSLLEAQKKIAEVSYNVGQFSRADVLQVDTQLASTQLDLLNAQIAMKLAKQQLERYIGRVIGADEDVAEVQVAGSYPVPSMDTLQQMLEDNRSEMRYAKSAYQAADYVKKGSISGFLPKLNAGLTFGWNGDDFDTLGGRENSYDGTRVLSFTATWNLFQGGYDYYTHQSNAYNLNASAFAVSDLRKTLRLQLSDAYEYYFSAREMVTAAKVAVAAAQESYRVTESLYENSEATTTDLLNASVALSNALNSLASANYTIITSVAQIERAVETPLLGLNIDDPDKEQAAK